MIINLASVPGGQLVNSPTDSNTHPLPAILMKNLLIILTAFFSLIFLSSCNSFEKDFYNAIDKGQIKVIKNNSADTFDLTSITNFQWDSVLIINGNESVPVTAEEIEPVLKRHTTDLPTFKDRFYFLQHDKTIITKEIESGIYSHKPAYDIEQCLIDSTHHRSWLARQECKFKLMYNSRTLGDGTVFLFPPCKTTVIPDSLKIFK